MSWALAVESYYLSEIEASLDRYDDCCEFPCFFCDETLSKPMDLFKHLVEQHQYYISKFSQIALFPEYLTELKKSPPKLMNSSEFGGGLKTTYYKDATELALRKKLHQKRLEFIVQEHELERTTIQTGVRCVFCSDVFDGTWHDYMQWLFNNHQFNPGRPTNLVFIPELVKFLTEKLDTNHCIYCDACLPNQRMLKSHMRKKKHNRIPGDVFFDRFYMVNYLDMELGWRNPNGPSDEDLTDTMESIEEAARDFDDEETNETSCIICDEKFIYPDAAIFHMAEYHGLSLPDTYEALGSDFYECVRFVNYARFMRSQNQCFVCKETVDGDYAEHVESHSNFIPQDCMEFRGNDVYLIPFIDSDPLLTAFVWDEGESSLDT